MCTLRAALMQAANNDIIQLSSGTYVLDGHGTPRCRMLPWATSSK